MEHCIRFRNFRLMPGINLSFLTVDLPQKEEEQQLTDNCAILHDIDNLSIIQTK